ncbi:hypothetical protein ACNFIA_18910 [Pseudomonas sp. NY15437]|uniref:hypothetical protein n=1 Tax=unclassified Pseudomonas TaxID=196821 RepID=UPI00223A7EC6|nr:hypothetical protein [Pseudomonas sp. GCEP-101]
MNMMQIAGLFENFIPSYACRATSAAQGFITLQFDSRVTRGTQFTLRGISLERVADERAIHLLSQTLSDEFALVRAGMHRQPRF